MSVRYPAAVEAERDALWEVHCRDGRPGAVVGVEDDEVAPVAGVVVDERDEVALIFLRGGRSGYEDRFARNTAGAEVDALGGAAVEVVSQDVSGVRVGVLDRVAVAVGETGAAVVDGGNSAMW